MLSYPLVFITIREPQAFFGFQNPYITYAMLRVWPGKKEAEAVVMFG